MPNATKAEREWMAAITRFGCIACYLMGYPGTPGVPHHLLDGGRRRGHLDTICLCDPGHHQNPPKGSGKIARHPTRVQFEDAYGTEDELLKLTRKIINGAALAKNPEAVGA